MFAFKSYRSFDAILRFFLQISTCYVKVLFYQVTKSDMFHRSHIRVFYRPLTCFVQFSNLLLTIQKHVSNKSRTWLASFFHVSNQVTFNKKDKSNSCVSFIITNNIFLSLVILSFLMNLHMDIHIVVGLIW